MKVFGILLRPWKVWNLMATVILRISSIALRLSNIKKKAQKDYLYHHFPS